MTDHQTQARMPSPGWIEDNRWQGLTQYFANPRFVDPESGLLGNTNNKSVDRDFPLHVSFEWGDTQRITRLERLMDVREVHTRDSFVEAQLDTVSAGGARSVVYRADRAGRHPRTPPPARTGASGRLERRDERTPARTADLRGLDAGAATTPDPRRYRATGR
jgi:penicillin amidase